MAPKVRNIIFIWFILVHPVITKIEMVKDIQIVKSESKSNYCSIVRPSPKTIVKRFQSMFPFFDVEQVNSAFLKKFQVLIVTMFEESDFLDREAAFYAVILTPLLFLHKYKDSWCVVEKFHEALTTYQNATPKSKKKYLKLLQNVRIMSQKVRDFIFNLPVNSKETKEITDSEEQEVGMEIETSTPTTDTIQMDITTITPLDDRKKFELNRRRAWSPQVLSLSTRATPAGPESHIVNDLLRDFIMHRTKQNKTVTEIEEGQEEVKFVKQLLKSLG